MWGAVVTAWQILANLLMDEYRRYVSIVCPQGYEPCALPLRHAGEMWGAVVTAWQILANLLMDDALYLGRADLCAGNRFRSCDLPLMRR